MNELYLKKLKPKNIKNVQYLYDAVEDVTFAHINGKIILGRTGLIPCRAGDVTEYEQENILKNLKGVKVFPYYVAHSMNQQRSLPLCLVRI